MAGPISDSMYRELLQKKYDIMQQKADTDRAEQVAKVPYLAAAAQEHAARANLVPAANAENWAKAKLYESEAEGVPAKTANYLAEASGRRAVTDIARQKWTQFDMPMEKLNLETLQELTPLQKEQKKAQMSMMTKLFESPEFQKQYFGLDTTKPIAKPAVARPPMEPAKQPSLWELGSEIDKDNTKWAPTGSAPVDWLARRGRNILLAVPRAIGAGAYGVSRWNMWND